MDENIEQTDQQKMDEIVEKVMSKAPKASIADIMVENATDLVSEAWRGFKNFFKN